MNLLLTTIFFLLFPLLFKSVSSFTLPMTTTHPHIRSSSLNLFRRTGSSSSPSDRQKTKLKKARYKLTKAELKNNKASNKILKQRISVLGGGNFALALASIAASNNVAVTLLVRSESDANSINTLHRHPRYMNDLTLPKLVVATTDPSVAFGCSPTDSSPTYIIHAVPVQYSRAALVAAAPFMDPSTPILSASKGIETTSLGFMADILQQTCGDTRPYAFLSGPSFAREIIEKTCTAVVIASEDIILADDLASVMTNDHFRVFTSRDVIGVEVGGSVKNVIAIAAGMCEGLGLGTNAMSSLVTRGCAEMRRLGLHLGASPSTLAGLSGVGDTFGTCFGPLSRNRNFGIRLGKGETMDEILNSTTEVAEGVDTCLALVNLIKKECKGYRLDLKYPIIYGMEKILRGEMEPAVGLEGLMSMPLRMESYE